MGQPGKVANPARGQLNRQNSYQWSAEQYTYTVCVCVCVVCVFSSHSIWTSSSLDVPARVTQEEGHTGFLIRSSFCGACLNFSREKDSAIPSTVKSNFCVLTI